MSELVVNVNRQELRRLRNSHEYSNSELAKIVGLSISRIEALTSVKNEATSKIVTLEKLAACFGVNVSVLMDGETKIVKRSINKNRMVNNRAYLEWDLNRVKQIMNDKNITIKHLSDLCGVGYNSISRKLQSNIQYNGYFIKQILQALETTYEDLCVKLVIPSDSKIVVDWRDKKYVANREIKTKNNKVIYEGYALDLDGLPQSNVSHVNGCIFTKDVVDFIKSKWKPGQVTTLKDYEMAASELGISISIVRNIFKKLGLISKKKLSGQERSAKANQLRQEGKSFKDISKIMNMAEEKIRRMLVAHQLHDVKPINWWMRREDIIKAALDPGITVRGFAAIAKMSPGGGESVRLKIREYFHESLTIGEVGPKREQNRRQAKGIEIYDEYAKDIDGKMFKINEKRKMPAGGMVLYGVIYPSNGVSAKRIILTQELAEIFKTLSTTSEIKAFTGLSGITISSIKKRLGMETRKPRGKNRTYHWSSDIEQIQDIDGEIYFISSIDKSGPVPLVFGHNERMRKVHILLTEELASWMRANWQYYIGPTSAQAAGFQKMGLYTWSKFKKRLGLISAGRQNSYNVRLLNKQKQEHVETIERAPWFEVNGAPEWIVKKAVRIAERIERDGISTHKNERLYTAYIKHISIKLDRAWRLVIGFNSDGSRITCGILHHGDYDNMAMVENLIRRVIS